MEIASRSWRHKCEWRKRKLVWPFSWAVLRVVVMPVAVVVDDDDVVACVGVANRDWWVDWVWVVVVELVVQQVVGVPNHPRPRNRNNPRQKCDCRAIEECWDSKFQCVSRHNWKTVSRREGVAW